MEIAIIGSGYVGLTTGACLAELGNKVVCVDNNAEKIKVLQSGKMPIYEPGLEKLVKQNVKRKRLSFTTEIRQAVAKSQVVFIAVGTPPKPNGEADLSAIENVTQEISLAIKRYIVIVEKSTVPVQTGEKVAETLQQSGLNKKLFDVVSNPEFLREGTAIKDFLHPDRIVVGTDSPKAAKIMKKLYSKIETPIILTDIRSAEIIKHASNAFLALKISFINSIARFCELVGADIEMVAEGVGLDKRVGKSFLKAGLGYGGICLPKDVDAFIKIAEQHGYDLNLLRDAQRINQEQRKHLAQKVEKALGSLSGKKVAVLGLAFKPNTDDMRDAPAITIINYLIDKGADIQAYDPKAEHNARQIFGNKVRLCKDAYDALKDADAAVVCTEWPEFVKLNFRKAKQLMKTPLIIDGRNLFSKQEMKKLGFGYCSIGR